ncbi:MAG: Menaquinone biosynthesis related protein, putative DHNA-CoA thioesterase [Chloroflexi bacterium AL-W]|nr:Menaquinone biosynthesis related protein, putative DHNA-CoA thioesterase [Chloroflexi bacterium AL-N1]NOK69526.1 Menaquinone biosynthesis related protein, putative DHNA-CoA thioesterase [Chloroflexi bacterium AL-N10]NOK77491.1 Menaquinone biosynthesis related protein, putative DHNA-CoA thioesterase [Chloroflexi bacterium AL-N5]NOK84342.1 Menaquinone biosynthesis related protein, putative DHNA-CoA thioesterase [Chloroflexi bacterium AL-W]NOK91492.1 Menaquinone biosynthesis related protein, pu
MISSASPVWLDRSVFPFTSCYRDLGVDHMHYVDEGAGAPLVFVHGVPTWSFNYRKLIAHFAPHYRCIAMDHLGFGLSSKPTDWSYNPPDLATHVEHLIDGLGLRNITLVVHDWGGPLSLSYAIKYSTNVRRIVLFNTWLWPSQGDLRTSLTARLLASPLYHLLEDRLNFTARFFIPQVMGAAPLPHSIHQHYIAPLRRRANRQGYWSLVRSIFHAGPWLDSLWQQRDRLADIPTLVMWGIKDKAFTQRDLNRWQNTLHNVRVLAYPQVGHFPHEEVAEAVCLHMGAFLEHTAR